MRVHLVDGTYELFRAHYSRRPDRTDPAGRDVKATVGLAETLLSLLHDAEEQVTHLAVAFDNPIESFRNELFAGYKDSSGVDPALLEQFDRAEQAVASLGVVVWSMAEHEADDALATAAARFAEGADVRILTIDKDLAQCVRGDRVVQVDRRNGVVYDEPGVRGKHGVGPASIPDYLALVGDTADGIPGIRGFGKKTAAAVLGRYPRLEDIPADGDDWDVEVRGATTLAGRLREQRQDAELYRRLATLATDVPLDERLDDLRWPGVPRDDLLAWAREVGATGVTSRDLRWAG